MATLPDGTALNLEKTEGWNLNPPAGLTLVKSEGWNNNPPPTAQFALKSDTQVAPGETVTATGKLVIEGSAKPDQTVSITVSGPADVSTPDPTTDANGDYSTTIGPFDISGEYTITATAPGIEQQINESWDS